MCDLRSRERFPDGQLGENSGESIKAISEMFKVSRYSLSRHLNHHRNPAVSVGSAGGDISTWLSRANDEYLLARADADSRGAIQALIAGLRACEAKAKQAERQAEAAEEEESDDGRVSIGSLDDVMEMFNRVPDDPVDREKLTLALAKARELNRVDGMTIFYRMLENGEFASDLVTFATNWNPMEKGTNQPLQTEATAPH